MLRVFIVGTTHFATALVVERFDIQNSTQYNLSAQPKNENAELRLVSPLIALPDGNSLLHVLNTSHLITI